MKRVLLCLVAIISGSFLFAQNKKGNLFLSLNLVGGGISFNKNEGYTTTYTYNPPELKTTSFNINIDPSLGYYVSDNIVIGTYLGIGISHGKVEYFNSATLSKTHNSVYVNISPYGRYYFNIGNNKKGMPFTEVNAGINFYPGYKEILSFNGGRTEESYDGYSSWNVGARIGYEHLINEIIGILYYMGYSYSYSKFDILFNYSGPPANTSSIMLKNHSNNIIFGVVLQIHFACAKKKK